MIEVCVLIFGSEINWKVSLDDPQVYALGSMPGVEFISPLVFTGIEPLMDAKRHQAEDIGFGYVGGRYVFRTCGIAFKIAPEVAEQYKPEDVSRFASLLSHQVPPLIEPATTLLRALRYFSKQADMSSGGDDLNIWEWLQMDELPVPALPRSSPMKRAIASSIAATSVTGDHIQLACACKADFRAPIYDTIFLDAISAYTAHDYRMTILYSAISLESASASILDDYFETTIRPSKGISWRVIEVTSGGGKSHSKDPVWEMLRAHQDANFLLHIGALYILGRSLQVDNQSLFQLTQRLRSTRNKIAHYGEPPELQTQQYLTLDAQGASDALSCVIAVFKWLGMGPEYKLHERGMVSLSDFPTNNND